MSTFIVSSRLHYIFLILILFLGIENANADTLFITSTDEFLKVRLSKYSTETVGEQYHPQQIIVLKEGKPYTGSVIKEKGIRMVYGGIFDQNAFYVDDEDQSTLMINYRNGRFFGEYYYDDPDVTIRFYFDADGKPEGKGVIRIKESNHWQKEFVPDIIPLISFSNNISNQRPVLDQYSEDIGKFDYQADQTLRIRPNDMSLYDLLEQISMPDANIGNCYLLDSIVYTFKSGKLQDIDYRSSCNFQYKLSPDNFIQEMPVLNSATTGGEKFYDFDYSVCLFSPSTYNLLLGGWRYYYATIIDGGYGKFFSSLDKLPSSGEIRADNYQVNIEFDIPLMKKNAERLKIEEVFDSNPAEWGYGQNIYEIDDYFVKSFQLTFESDDLKVHTVYHKNGDQYYLESNFVLKGSNAEHTGNEYNGRFVTAGDFSNGLIDSIYYMTDDQSMNVSYGTHNLFLLKRTSGEEFHIEMRGRLAFDQRRRLDVVEARVNAKLHMEGSYISLINDGEARFIFSDGSEKIYNYKNGEIKID